MKLFCGTSVSISFCMIWPSMMAVSTRAGSSSTSSLVKSFRMLSSSCFGSPCSPDAAFLSTMTLYYCCCSLCLDIKMLGAPVFLLCNASLSVPPPNRKPDVRVVSMASCHFYYDYCRASLSAYVMLCYYASEALVSVIIFAGLYLILKLGDTRTSPWLSCFGTFEENILTLSANTIMLLVLLCLRYSCGIIAVRSKMDPSF